MIYVDADIHSPANFCGSKIASKYFLGCQKIFGYMFPLSSWAWKNHLETVSCGPDARLLAVPVWWHHHWWQKDWYMWLLPCLGPWKWCCMAGISREKVISHGRLAVSLLKSLQKRTYRQVRSMVLANVKVSWIQEALWCRILRFLFGHHSQMEGPNRFACFRNQYQKWKKMMDLKHSAGFYPTEVQKTPSNHRVLLELVFWMEDLCFGTMIWIPVISNNTLRLVFLGGCWFLHRFENPTEKERCCVTLLYFFVSSGLTNLLNDQTNPMTWFQNNVDTFVLRRQGWVPNMTWTPYCHGWTFRQWKNGWFIET